MATNLDSSMSWDLEMWYTLKRLSVPYFLLQSIIEMSLVRTRRGPISIDRVLRLSMSREFESQVMPLFEVNWHLLILRTEVIWLATNKLCQFNRERILPRLGMTIGQWCISSATSASLWAGYEGLVEFPDHGWRSATVEVLWVSDGADHVVGDDPGSH